MTPKVILNKVTDPNPYLETCKKTSRDWQNMEPYFIIQKVTDLHPLIL